MLSLFFASIDFINDINLYIETYQLKLITYTVAIDNVPYRMFKILKNTSNIGLLDEAKIESELTIDMITFDNVLYFISNCLSIFEYYQSKSNLLSMIVFLSKSNCELSYYQNEDRNLSDYVISTIQSFISEDELSGDELDG